jgi:hypothetical protein
MGSLQQPLQPETVLRFGSLEFMSLDGSYDMVLLLPRQDDNDGLHSPGGGELYDSIPPRQKRSTPVVPATLLVGGGGDGATMATQEAAPCRLSHQSESTTPALPRGTCRTLPSNLGRRRVSLPRDVSALSGLMTPAPSRRTCWALPSYLR